MPEERHSVVANQGYGTWLTRRFNFLLCALRHPAHLVRWLRDRIRNESPLDQAVPWISWPAYEFLNRNLRDRMQVFEWGGGGSTLFFLKRGCVVTTVEDDPLWKGAIERRASELNEISSQLLMHLVRLQNGDDNSVGRYTELVQSANWDVVLIDGADPVSRVECVEKARSHVLPGGWLILDDAYRASYSTVPAILIGWRRLEFWGLGPGRRGVTKTDIYVCPGRN